VRSAQQERIVVLDDYKRQGRNDYFELGMPYCKAAVNTPEYTAYMKAFDKARQNDIKNEASH